MLLDKVEDPTQLTELKDERNYSPLYYAAAEGSIANLSLLLDLDGQDGKVIEACVKGGKNVLFKGRTYETVMLLSRYGADKKHRSDNNDTALKYLTKKANQEAPLALLDQELDEEGEEIYTLKFDIFKDNETKPEDNQAKPFDLHNCFIENERNDLILHPLMETYLQVKWRQVRKVFIFEFLLRLLFVISLTYMAWRYMALTTCEYEDDHGNYALGYVPIKGCIFKPKVNNFLYFLNNDERVGVFENKTHSNWTKTTPHFSMIQTHPISCSNDYLSHQSGTLEPLCQVLRNEEIGKF